MIVNVLDAQRVARRLVEDAAATYKARGKEVGLLWLGARRSGAAYTARDQKALQQCADAVAEAISLWDGALRKQLDVTSR